MTRHIASRERRARDRLRRDGYAVHKSRRGGGYSIVSVYVGLVEARGLSLEAVERLAEG